MSEVAFRVDADARRGVGHAMRCLALADRLAAQGWRATFAGSALGGVIADRIEAAGHRTIRLPLVPALAEPGEGWDGQVIDPAAQQADAKAFCEALPVAPDWIVVDHYQLDAAWERAARGASRLLVIDDLANRPHDADLLLDQTLGREPHDYASWVGETTRLLLGPGFAMLRPEFAAERPAALARREVGGPIDRVLIALGSADLGGWTLPALDAVRSCLPNANGDVVIAATAPAFASLQQRAAADPAITLHTAPPSMAALMRDADLAIGAGGVSTWERCCLGLPTVLAVLAMNQRENAVRLGQAGVVRVADDADDLVRALDGLASDATERSSLSRASFAMTDGMGIERVVQAILDHPLKAARA